MARNGIPDRERLRLVLYKRLIDFGNDAMPALSRGLSHADFRVRRNVCLYLHAAPWFYPEVKHRGINIYLALPALVLALEDSDATVRAWAADTIGSFGTGASVAIPSLIRLLEDKDEGPRNNACNALRSMAPVAKEALPALRRALSDPMPNVRGLARAAIKEIEKASTVTYFFCDGSCVRVN
jgi:HEAT repeat protein